MRRLTMLPADYYHYSLDADERFTLSVRHALLLRLRAAASCRFRYLRHAAIFCAPLLMR